MRKLLTILGMAATVLSLAGLLAWPLAAQSSAASTFESPELGPLAVGLDSERER